MFGNDTEDRAALIVAGPGVADPQQLAAGSMMISAQGGDSVIITAQKVAQPRDTRRVLSEISILAGAAGTDWYYSIPFNDRKNNRVTYVEGLSVKGAMEVARMFGNCQVDARVEDQGHSWTFYARFVDLETGFTLVRPFQARKSAAEQAMKDRERALDIAFQIGASKALRNVVVNALQTFSNHAFDEAKSGIVRRIEKDVARYRSLAAEALGKLDIDLLRVERVRAKAFDSWTARDLALISGEIQSIKDGLANASEVYPVDGPAAGDAAEGATATTAIEKVEERKAAAPRARRQAQPKAEPEVKPETAKEPAQQPQEERKPEPEQQPAAAEREPASGGAAAPEAEAEDWEAWLSALEDELDRRGTIIDVNSAFGDLEDTLDRAPLGIQNRASALKNARVAELRAQAQQ